MAELKVAPYGAWKSPITSDLIVTGAIRLEQILLDGQDIYWNELRPAEGEYSHAELAGCEVWSGPDRVGMVRGVEEYGGPPLLQVEAEDGREILIPFTRSICKVIDVAEKIIRVEAPEGLLDLK